MQKGPIEICGTIAFFVNLCKQFPAEFMVFIHSVYFMLIKNCLISKVQAEAKKQNRNDC